MLLLTSKQKRTRDEDSENSEACRDRHRRMLCGRIHDFECKAYVPSTGIFEIRLSAAFEHNWAYVALFVYSHDFTAQAIEDLGEIQRHARHLKQRKILPMAMSTDTVLAHQAFVQRMKPDTIDFPVLSDAVRLVSSHLGILDTIKGCSKRAMFVINQDRMLLVSHLLDDVTPYPVESIFVNVPPL